MSGVRRQFVDEPSYRPGAQYACLHRVAELPCSAADVPVLLENGPCDARLRDGESRDEVPVLGVQMSAQRSVEVCPLGRHALGVEGLDRHQYPGQQVVDSVVIGQQGVTKRRSWVLLRRGHC